MTTLLIADDEQDFAGGNIGRAAGVLVRDRAQNLLVLGGGRVSGQKKLAGRSVVGTGDAKTTCQAGVIG